MAYFGAGKVIGGHDDVIGGARMLKLSETVSDCGIGWIAGVHAL
jgi:hypothetical protein